MFTGIIEAQGHITCVQSIAEGRQLWVHLGTMETGLIHPGNSIAVNGVCLTVTEIRDGVGCFDISDETLSKCLVGSWKVNDPVNLETALTLSKPLGGHLISGHVDGTGLVETVLVGAHSTWMRIRVPETLGRYLAIKGSVAVDGISLTTNRVYDEQEETVFELTLVPHTMSITNLGQRVSGDRVHIEVDLLARYLERLLQSQKDSTD